MPAGRRIGDHAAPLGRAFDFVGASPELRRFVIGELSSPARHWHGLLHHAMMLRDMFRADVTTDVRRRLILAALFHDIVYRAERDDNEERSADVAGQWVAAEDREAVRALILATKRHDLDTDAATRILLLADLGVLWTPSARLYAFYASGIRREYAHVADDAYRAGRGAVLTRLADGLRAQLDAGLAARLDANVAWEIAGLDAGAFDLRPRP